jgi:hypothetical protein
MDARSGVGMSVLFVLAAACSESKLRPGHCEDDQDCPAGERCILEGAATYTCAVMDASVPNGDASAVEVAPECTVATQCPGEKPICDTGSCRPCDATRLSDGPACASRDGTQPICGPAGACVQCVSATSSDCNTDPAKPICDLKSNSCVACTTDADCVTKGVGPGICMSQQDGRCVADSEVIYVENTASCALDALTTGAGSAATPFCEPQNAMDAVTPSRSVLLISGSVAGLQWNPVGVAAAVSLIGRASAAIVGGLQAGISISGTEAIYARDITIRTGEKEGVTAGSGSMLQLESVTIDSNLGGGILLDGAAFDIRNSTISNNGPSADLSWGGIRVQSLPASGSTAIQLTTIQGNKAPGLSCAAAIQGVGVFASGNSTGDISPTCGIVACAPPGPTCGAQ